MQTHNFVFNFDDSNTRTYLTMKRAIILEDNPMGVSNLKNMLAQNCEDVLITGSTGTIKEGLKLLEQPEMQPDIVFLDIELEDGSAFELLDKLVEINFEVIFISAFGKYTGQACNYSSIGYITKPIDPDDLKSAVGRVRPGRKYWTRERVEVFEAHFRQHPNPVQQMVVPTTTGWHFLKISDILYLKGDGSCSWFFMKNGRKFFACRVLREYYELLSSLHFFRIHKSTVVNLNEIDVFNNRESEVLMKDGSKHKVSRRTRPYFLAVLRKWGKGLGDGNADFNPPD
ncbi:MAG: response regulator transcription factor [Saprospiraceae bacterium]|nr:MAG: response regulator transcription factor [Saprospiraceae bacterium]